MARLKTPRGQSASALSANSQRNSSVFGSNGISRQVSGRILTGASGKAVCQPVKVTLS